MKLLSLSGALLAIDSITTVNATTPIYDISVTGVHNYYAGEAMVLVHNTNACDLNVQRIFGSGNNLLSPFARRRLSTIIQNTDNLNLSQYADFINQLDGSGAFRDFIKQVDDPALGLSDAQKAAALLVKVNAWKKVKTLKPYSKLATDIDALTVIGRQLDDADLMAKIGANRYNDIIKNYTGQCATCDPPAAGASEAVKHLPPHHEMLQTLETFANKHHGKPGFDDVLDGLKNTDPRTQKGGEFVTRILKNDNDVAAFEYEYIGGQNNTADWINLAGTKIDGKSWSVTGSINKIGGWAFPKQLKDYFASPPFEMWFDHLRFTKSSNSTYNVMSKAAATVHIKKQYQKLFEKPAKAQELFDHITNNGANVQAFQNLFGVNNVNSFINNVVSDLNNASLYGAFKVK